MTPENSDSASVNGELEQLLPGSHKAPFDFEDQARVTRWIKNQICALNHHKYGQDQKIHELESNVKGIKRIRAIVKLKIDLVPRYWDTTLDLEDLNLLYAQQKRELKKAQDIAKLEPESGNFVHALLFYLLCAISTACAFWTAYVIWRKVTTD